MIRRATPDDAARLAEFGARMFHDTFAAHNRPEDMAAFLSTAYGPEVQLAEITDPARITLVVEEGEALVAYAQLRVDIPQVEIGRFYVDNAWHGRGIAQSLMSSVFSSPATSARRDSGSVSGSATRERSRFTRNAASLIVDRSRFFWGAICRPIG